MDRDMPIEPAFSRRAAAATAVIGITAAAVVLLSITSRVPAAPWHSSSFSGPTPLQATAHAQAMPPASSSGDTTVPSASEVFKDGAAPIEPPAPTF